MTHENMSFDLALIDLDGTLHRGAKPIAGADDFVSRLRRKGIQPVFFTNNATRTPEQVCAKLSGFGIAAAPDEVCTSAQATAAVLRRRCPKGSKVLYLGQEGLRTALADAGLIPVHVRKAGPDHDFEAAVLGLDPDVTYADFARFCSTVMDLGWWVLSNSDVRLPAEDGFLPGNGALGSFVSTATEVAPYVAGKPNPDFVQFALERFGVTAERAVVIGDNVQTDIAAGRLAGVYSIQVQTGVTYDNGSDSRHGTEPNRIRADEIHDSVQSLFRNI